MIANETTLHKRPKMTQKLTTIGHRTAFNNDQNLYRLVSNKRPKKDKWKAIKTNGII